ncbi:TetR-like C-terminal domain-containing protein [Bifidobacterium longum]|uniref:TetR-like C-terminal domain-containing protein n=1 Tax=Bifidobacterium longum TaxID=216816 RepID=UPI00117C1E21|nr:TetR-like C-terminal domain-containing protein [Bifidobacterium longum]
MRYVKREYAFFDALSRSGNDMQMYDRVKDVLKQMLLGQAARVGAELSYSGIPRDYALEILVSAVSSIIWLWIRRGCKEVPEQICAIIEKNKTTAPVDIIR